MSDREEISELVYRLVLMIDERRFDEAPSILAPDVGVETPGGRSTGIEAVVAQARRVHAPYTTQHLMTNVIVAVDGDRADVRAQVHATFVPGEEAGDDPLPGTRGGRYRVGAVRRPEGWRISDLAVETIWTRRDVAGVR